MPSLPLRTGTHAASRHLTLFILPLLCALPVLRGVAQTPDPLLLPGESHLANIRQLTFGGENAEGYFSFDEHRLIFQATHSPRTCDQEYVMNLDDGSYTMVSNGKGRTTCGYFLPGDSTILFASTHGASSECPPVPDHTSGYVWAIYPSYDIYVARADGSGLKPLAASPGYDAEATVSPTGDRIVFTSTRDGDLDLYSMKIDGSDVHRLTNETGYDGGAFYSWDGATIVYRAGHPTDSAAVAQYRQLLAQNLVKPSRMELFVMNADGTGKRQITNNGAANFAPFFHPDNKRIIFASNVSDPRGRNFDLYMINVDGQGLTRITFNETFDGFPMFTRDGKHLVFASNRHGKQQGETNLFIADWVDAPGTSK
jgi:TolB protein